MPDKPIAVADSILAASEFGLPSFTPQERRREKEFVIDACRGARRFFLDDEVTRAASLLGQSHPEILIEALRRARTPYRRVLIDYSPAAFMEAGGSRPAEDIPARSMVLVEHLGGSTYRMTPMGCFDNFAFAQSISILYNLETPIGPHADQDLLADIWARSAKDRGIRVVTPQGTSDFAYAEFTREHAIKMVRSCLFGGGRSVAKSAMFGTESMMISGKAKRVHRGGVIDGVSVGPMLGDSNVIAGEPLDQQTDEVEETRRQQVDRFKAHAYHQFTPCNALAFRRLIQGEMDRNEKPTGASAMEVVAEAINEYSGQWRLIICALYLINGQDFTSSDSTWKGGAGQRIVRGKIVPYLEHRLVSLKVPHIVAIRKATKVLGEAIPRRRHEVGGHWAHRRSKGDPSCAHVWVKMTESREQCALCEYDRWWIKDYERGDASLGYVTKDHLVERR